MVICDYTSGITRSVGAMLLDGSKIVKNLNMFAEMVRFDQASLVRPPNPPLHTPLTTTNPTPPPPPRLHPRTNHPPELNPSPNTTPRIGVYVGQGHTPPCIRFLDTLTGVHQQAFRLLMRGNRLAELGLDIQQPRPTVEVALLRLLEINTGCIDITPMNTLLMFSVDKFIGKNEIIGSFTIRKICTVECASAATRTTDMDWVKNAPPPPPTHESQSPWAH